MKFRIFYLFIFCLINSAFAQTNQNLKNEINKALIEEGLTGAAWSVVDADGKITYDAVGLSNKETGTHLKPTDKVHIGSITKTLIATGILRLATENKLNLNDPVSKYLPHLSFENKWEKNCPITIRHLLDHTSGLTDIRLWQIFSKSAHPNSPLELAFKRDPKVLKVHTQPGSIFSYSNMGYTLLAMIVESVTKEKYESYLDKNLLMPLGMTNSTFQFVSQVGENADKRLAFGHLDKQKIFPSLPMYLRPAGQFTTTAYDMAIFAKFLLSDGTVNGKMFIDYNYLLQMGKAQNTISIQKGLLVGYGLGAILRDRHGQIGLAHSGNIVGYHAMLYWFPKFKKAFFISHNMDSETANYERFNKILIQYLNLDTVLNRPKKVQTKGLEDWAGYYLPVFPKVESFAYADILSGFTKVKLNDSMVILSPFQKAEKILYQVDKYVLIAEEKSENSHIFYKDSSGKVFISDAFSTHQKVSGYYLLAHWISFILGCIGLLILFFSGIFQMMKSKKRVVSNPIFASFMATILLLLPMPFFFLQSFVALGDKTVASMLLFFASCFLPIGLAFSFGYYLKNGIFSPKNKLNFIALILALQWIVVLFAWNLIPFRLWA
ncbi:MAG: serine hydrolase domain-containing protein [Emticicia sp.]|uniref:serine hydrolase domain-containing protein n=1 Tax=Emticicia sp. TaxID=1930953 RepID=UPI003BA72FCA